MLVGNAAGVNTLVRLKALKVLKLKLLALKAHHFAPALGPVALAKASLTAMINANVKEVAGKVVLFKHSLLKLPVSLVAMKVGAIAGAHAGARAGLKTFEAKRNRHLTPGPPPPPPVPEPEAPSYGHKTPAYAPPAPAPETPAYAPPVHETPAYAPPAPEAPSYDPPAPAVHYRKRRDAEDSEETVTDEDIREAFIFMNTMDENRCVNRALCEIAVEPEIAMGNGNDVLNFIKALSNEESAPWMPYKKAVDTGVQTKSRDACVKEYPVCDQTAEDLIEKALSATD